MKYAAPSLISCKHSHHREGYGGHVKKTSGAFS